MENVSNSFNKHFVQIGNNLLKQIVNAKYNPEYYIRAFQE